MKDKIIKAYRRAQCDVDLFINDQIQEKIYLGYTSDEVKIDLLQEHRQKLNNSNYARVISKCFEIVDDFKPKKPLSMFADFISSHENAKESDDFYSLFLSMLIVDRLKVKPKSEEIEPKSEEIEPKSEEKCKPEFTIIEVAMIYYFKGVLIDRSNADEKIEKYGNNSGEKLYYEYLKIANINEFIRRFAGDTERKFGNLMRRFDKIMNELNMDEKQKAEKIKELIISKRESL